MRRANFYVSMSRQHDGADALRELGPPITSYRYIISHVRVHGQYA